MDTSALKAAGLTDGEVKVYLALLELGSATTGPIIEKSGIARSIVYQILEKLLDKGLASYIIKEKTKYYQAAEPRKILEYLDARQAKLEENKRQVAQLLPELELKQQLAAKSEARIYTGFKGITTAHEHTYNKLTKGEEYYYLGISPLQRVSEHAYWQRDHLRRAEAGIKCKLLFNHATEDKILKNRNSYDGCDARRMEEGVLTPGWILIYKDTVVISEQAKSQIAVEITNQDIADSFKAYFDQFWKQSKPFTS